VITDEHPYMEFFRHQGGNMDDRDIGPLMDIPQDGWEWVTGLPSDLSSGLARENRALRLHVRSKTDRVDRYAVEAARMSQATEYFRYPLGCTSRQYQAVERLKGWSDRKKASHHQQCDAMLGLVSPYPQR
jgi:hypothetical protein